MLTPGDRVVAAVSGGRDSVCLLAVLCEVVGRVGASVTGVAHLNHKLRGDASEEDERFVAGLAARHGVPFYREEAAVGQAAGNLEQAARRARLQFFSRLIAEGKANRVATGHTRDDQAETVLFRLLRGSGLAGLAGILPVTKEGLIRPLLDAGRAEVEDFLRMRGMSWREDASNRDHRFARNRIRHDLLPQLAGEWNPGISGALGHMADLAGEEERWWQGKIARLGKNLLVESDGGVEIRADAVAALPLAVSRRLVRHVVRRAGGRAMEFEHVEKAISLARSERASGCLELPGLLVRRSFDWLRFAAAGAQLLDSPEPVRVEAPGRYPWAGGEICFEITEKPEGPGCARLKLKRQSVAARLELRGWRAGDHYRPWGRSRDQKIKEMLQRARVPSWKREFWPIVTNGCKILWVRKFGAAAEFAADGAPGPSLVIWEEPKGGWKEQNGKREQKSGAV
jgi:tRNA(Ile)-lysidine synthase